MTIDWCYICKKNCVWNHDHCQDDIEETDYRRWVSEEFIKGNMVPRKHQTELNG